jgi:hypothetical protein
VDALGLTDQVSDGVDARALVRLVLEGVDA